MKFEKLSSEKKHKLNKGSSHQSKSPDLDSESDSFIDLNVSLLDKCWNFELLKGRVEDFWEKMTQKRWGPFLGEVHRKWAEEPMVSYSLYLG
jgi:hypothetical protein